MQSISKNMATQPRRLLFLISRFLDGGIDTVLVEYLNHLSRDSRYAVTLAIGTAMDGLEVFGSSIPQQVNVVHLVSSPWLTRGPKARVLKRISKVGKMADEVLAAPLRRMLIAKRLRRLAAQHDVVIDFDCCFYSPLRHIEDRRKIAFFHFTFDLVQQQDPRRMRRLSQRLGQYDKVVVLSRAIQAEGERLLPHLKEKFVVVYNPKDPERLKALAAERVDNPLIGTPFVLAVERLTEPKDIPTLLLAFKLLREQYGHREQHLVVIGKGEQEKALREMAAGLGLKDCVAFLGFESNPYPWVAACQLMAFSSKSEGLGVVLIEAMLLDRPIVSTDSPTGPREVLGDGRAGVLTPVGDAEAMAEAMHRVLTEPLLQQQLAEGRQEQARRFTFDEADKTLERIFS